MGQFLKKDFVLLNQILFVTREKDQQVSDQSQEMYVNNSRELHMHAQLSALQKNKTENDEKNV